MKKVEGGIKKKRQRTRGGLTTQFTQHLHEQSSFAFQFTRSVSIQSMHTTFSDLLLLQEDQVDRRTLRQDCDGMRRPAMFFTGSLPRMSHMDINTTFPGSLDSALDF